MPIIHVSYAFTRLPDTSLNDFAGTIVESMTGNASFPNPPVTMAALTAAQEDFSGKIAALAQGGPSATAAKNESRVALLHLLRDLAAHVELVSDNDLAVLLSSGFKATSSTRAQVPLPKAQIRQIKNGNSTQLIVEAAVMKNARSWEARWKIGTGDWHPAANLKPTRKMTIIDLTPGSLYTIQMRALGGATGYSDWSDAVTHMAT